jgi:hypothetical protein
MLVASLVLVVASLALQRANSARERKQFKTLGNISSGE